MNTRALLASAAIAVLSCGHGDSTSDVARQEACKKLVDGVIAAASRCIGLGGEPPFERERHDLAAACDATFDSPGVPLDIAAQFSACGAKFASPTCPDEHNVLENGVGGALDFTRRALAACNLNGGRLADDAPCWADFQCAAGGCALPGASARCGKCAPRVPRREGEACAESAPFCAPGLDCVLERASLVCRSPRGVGDPCYYQSDCKGGLWCSRGSDSDIGRCQDPLEEGARCSGFGCAPGLGCDGTTCVAARLVPLGSPCGGIQPCADGVCSLSPAPGAPRTCVAYLAEGASCSSNVQCHPGLFCEADATPSTPTRCTRALYLTACE